MTEKLARFLKKHIPSFENIISCERLSGGASQETYRLIVKADGQQKMFAFRRAQTGQSSSSIFGAPPGLAVEARLMRIAQQHGVPEPDLIAVLSEDDQLGEGFVMQWLDGETLGKRVLTAKALDKIRPQLAFQCGEILARIHAVDPVKTELVDHLIRQTPRQALAQAYQTYQLFATPRPMIDYTAYWLEDNLPQDAELTLIHNDFRNGNLIVAPQGIAAVLDWELACISDPMRDLGWLCANCWRFGASVLPVGGFGRYEELFRGYESVSARRVDRARVKFWQVFASFWWAIICLGMAAQWRSGADQSVERCAIGRRASESEMDCVNLLIPGAINDFEGKQTKIGLDMPEQEELLKAVRDHLRAQKAEADKTRAGFLSLVSANMLDIVLRQSGMGAEHQKLEHEALQKILNQQGDLLELRWILIQQMREKKISLNNEKLTSYLRQQTARQVMIDQPNYSGLKTARALEK